MSRFLFKDKTAIQDFVRGCTFFATGGGGLPNNGIASLNSELDAGRSVGWIDASELDDDALVVCPFLMGSIAPHTPEVTKEMEGFGLVSTVNTEKDRLKKAVEELADYTGKKISAIVPIELAGANTSGAVAAAAALGIPVLDGDYTGRAIPEIQQTTPYLHGKTILPITSVDEWGNVAILKSAINYRVTERIGKLISAGAYGLAGQAGFLMKAADAKKIIIAGTMTESYELGRFIRERREAGKAVVKDLADKLHAWILIEGEVTGKEEDDRLGYYWGTNTITGIGRFSGEVLKVWFKNENHVSWKNGKPFVTSPDIISLVDLKTGEPIPNPLVRTGQKVAVIGMKARSEFRTPKGIDILGPRYFGHDFDYRPVENFF
ncbi:DUF917 domain-containing protein [Sediminispirochaeta smaragdinae]|jgi:hypothetical protein|uniref:DUF917 domain-containing protein n=1 Tax=Sediminispirochaeta smaragdinae (strain DSM 11293 / JCM 15392 / SEBR 4228) TaxID=573413 RepID=E1R7P4_SEDSS|nr:DUF917 domain-containing protein [Sediminispirochaeta smaragdinae]ADK82749.1 protein of unknown function DUF917 [Sediminispirochaeta smaragdinae DSM 11293]